MTGFFTALGFSPEMRPFSSAGVGAIAGEFTVVQHLLLPMGIQVGHVCVHHAAGGAAVFDCRQYALDIRLRAGLGVEGEGQKAGGDEDVPVVGVHGDVLARSIVGVGLLSAWEVSGLCRRVVGFVSYCLCLQCGYMQIRSGVSSAKMEGIGR